VGDVDEAVAFYSKLFGTRPAKRRPGYANFAIAEPPLKLVLIQSGLPGGTLNHLGVEVENSDEVSAATQRLASGGLDTDVEDSVSCCYAVQDKVWVSDPDGARWEVYTVLGDAPNLAPVSPSGEPQACNCCGAPAPAGETAASVQNSCC
jgi:catechol 2,3-dioxygenase-like lactoylglutathione lyase family enzyme